MTTTEELRAELARLIAGWDKGQETVQEQREREEWVYGIANFILDHRADIDITVKPQGGALEWVKRHDDGVDDGVTYDYGSFRCYVGAFNDIWEMAIYRTVKDTIVIPTDLMHHKKFVDEAEARAAAEAWVKAQS